MSEAEALTYVREGHSAHCNDIFHALEGTMHIIGSMCERHWRGERMCERILRRRLTVTSDDPRPLEWSHLTGLSLGQLPQPFDPFEPRGGPEA